MVSEEMYKALKKHKELGEILERAYKDRDYALQDITKTLLHENRKNIIDAIQKNNTMGKEITKRNNANGTKEQENG